MNADAAAPREASRRMEPRNEAGDLVTLAHQLMWENECFTATHTHFQALFEDAMQLLEGERFTPIRTYPPDGDWKADGVLDDGETVFQVYSPNETTLPKVKAKIATDLPGAVEYWEEIIEEWVFVYNRRAPRGLAPEIVAELRRYSSEYPALNLRKVSDADLWDRLRDELSPGKRSELLGPAAARWDEVFLPPGNNPADFADELGDCRLTILHPLDRPIDPAQAVEALKPERSFGPPYRLNPHWGLDWEDAAEAQQEEVDELIENVGDQIARFAIFSQAPIPLAVHLGQMLSDRVDTELFQYDRDRGSWSWDPAVNEEEVDTNFRVLGIPDDEDGTVTDVCVRFSLSAFVSDEDITGAGPNGNKTIRVEVEEPDVMWLCHRSQLTALEQLCREVWKQVRRKYPGAERIHVFYAGPAPGAIVLGRSFNPRMNPPLWLYEYDRNKDPRYDHVLTLGG